MEDLDISILVNNVGVDVLDFYHKLSEEEIIRLININCGACSVLSHIFIPRFLKRNSKSAIVNVASLAGISQLTQDKYPWLSIISIQLLKPMLTSCQDLLAMSIAVKLIFFLFGPLKYQLR